MASAVVWTARGRWGLADRFRHRPFAQEHLVSLPSSKLSFPHTECSRLTMTVIRMQGTQEQEHFSRGSDVIQPFHVTSQEPMRI